MVQAVRVHECDILEKSLDRPSPHPDSSVLEDESLFIAQLHRRACLLDSRFKHKVFQILAETIVHQGSYQDERLEGEPKPHWMIQKTIGMVFNEEMRILEVSVGFFRDGPAKIEMHLAPTKSIERMREKLFKYVPPHPNSQWPRTANILDPIRLTLSCNGPQHVLETVSWFVQSQDTTGLTVCRMKNKFLLPEHEVADGYRDVTLNVTFKDESGLAVICEIQVHDKQLHALKVKMHKLYKVNRAKNATLIT